MNYSVQPHLLEYERRVKPVGGGLKPPHSGLAVVAFAAPCLAIMCMAIMVASDQIAGRWQMSSWFVEFMAWCAAIVGISGIIIAAISIFDRGYRRDFTVYAMGMNFLLVFLLVILSALNG